MQNSSDSELLHIHVAAQNGGPTDVKRQVNAAVSVDSQEQEGYTPVHWAAQDGHLEATASLLRSEANLNIRDCEGFAPREIAATSGRRLCGEIQLTPIFFLAQMRNEPERPTFDAQRSQSIIACIPTPRTERNPALTFISMRSDRFIPTPRGFLRWAKTEANRRESVSSIDCMQIPGEKPCGRLRRRRSDLSPRYP
jgi:hypothetical protein